MCGNQSLVTSCHTYPLHAMNAIQRSSLTVRQRYRALVTKIFSDKKFYFFEDILLTPLSATEAFQQFMADISNGELGVAYVMHLLLPHEGYIYSADCSLLPPDKWRGQYTAKGKKGLIRENAKKIRTFNYQSYIEQMTCTNRLIGSLFRQLKNRQIYDDATIISHGDHGSRITGLGLDITSGIELSNQDLLDSYSTLIAIKLPGIAPKLNSTPISIQQLFARRFLNLPAQDSNQTPSTVMFTNSDGIVSEHTIHWPNHSARQ